MQRESLLTCVVPRTLYGDKQACDIMPGVLRVTENNKRSLLSPHHFRSDLGRELQWTSTTSTQVIQKPKSLFERFGISDEVVSDNGPQFSSVEFRELARWLDFKHCTSSPHQPQCNGHAERAVQTAKKILKQEDPLMALMCYRSIPCSTTGFSPAEPLVRRKIRTSLPTLEKNLLPKWPSRTAVKGSLL